MPHTKHYENGVQREDKAILFIQSVEKWLSSIPDFRAEGARRMSLLISWITKLLYQERVIGYGFPLSVLLLELKVLSSYSILFKTKALVFPSIKWRKWRLLFVIVGDLNEVMYAKREWSFWHMVCIQQMVIIRMITATVSVLFPREADSLSLTHTHPTHTCVCIWPMPYMWPVCIYGLCYKVSVSQALQGGIQWHRCVGTTFEMPRNESCELAGVAF